MMLRNGKVGSRTGFTQYNVASNLPNSVPTGFFKGFSCVFA